MTWSLRHAGSPRTVEGLSTTAVLDGLASGNWDTDDEVKPDGGGEWQPLEQHPTFAEAAGEIDPPRLTEHEDETRLDMNPLIDVALVLLIFFILTTTYETIRKVLDMPGATGNKPNAGVQRVSLDKIKEFVIRVKVRSEAGRPVIHVEDKPVVAAELTDALRRLVGPNKRQVLLDAQGVEWGTVVMVMDAAKAAGVEKTLMVKH